MQNYSIIKKSLWLLIIGVLISGCVYVCCNSRSFNYRGDKQVTVSSALPAGGQLYADLTHMDLTVLGGQTNECAVVADLSVSATSQEILDSVLEQLDVQLIRESDRLMIVIRRPQEYSDDSCVSGRMTITVPAETNLEMITTHGDCRVEDIARDINIRSTHGDFVFDNVRGDVTAVSTHGDITLTNTQNTSVNVKTTHGRIELSDCCTRRVCCKTTHDPIRLRTVSADTLELQTTHDPIELTECTAKEAKLNTTHGSICGDVSTIERIDAKTSHAPVRLRCINDTNPNIIAAVNTTHNNIEFCPPAEFAGNLSASTSHGHIRSDWPMMVQGIISEDQLNGSIGQGSGSITLTSTHGNIILNKP